MFSALSQGSLIHILDKTNGLAYKTGEVIGVTQPVYNLAQPIVDIKVKIDGIENDFKGIPGANSLVSYNSNKLVLSETKQGLQTEVENILHSSKQIVENIDTYKQTIVNCEQILKEINPQFAKDKERDERIDNLDVKVNGIQGTLDKIVDMLNNKN